jgi:hypothetical protein
MVGVAPSQVIEARQNYASKVQWVIMLRLCAHVMLDPKRSQNPAAGRLPRTN